MSFPVPNPNMYPFDTLSSHAFFSPQREFDLTPLYSLIQSEIHNAKTHDAKEHLLNHNAILEGMQEVWDILESDDQMDHFFQSLRQALNAYRDDHKVPTSDEWQHLEDELNGISTHKVNRKKAIEAFNYSLGIVAGLKETNEASDYEYAYGLVDALHALELNPPQSEQHYLFDTLHQDLNLLKSSHADQAKQLVLEDVHNIYKWLDKHAS